MGNFCFKSLNRIRIQPLFDRKEIVDLTELWTILKSNNVTKYADEIVFRSMDQSSILRHFWSSKFLVDGNNYDFSDGDSCLRTERSWHLGLREQSVHLISALDRLLSSVKDENLFLSQLRTLQLLQSISTLDQQSLVILQQSIIEVTRQRFQELKIDFHSDYERVWKKFFSIVVENLSDREKKLNTRFQPAQIVISPATFIDQTSANY